MLVPGRRTARIEVERVRDGSVRTRRDAVAVEEPLEIRLSLHGEAESLPVAVTMRTPGEDHELAAGFLYGEEVVRRAEDVIEIAHCGAGGEGEDRYNRIRVALAPGVTPDPSRLVRSFYTTSACGVCGKPSLEALDRLPGPSAGAVGFRVDPRLLRELPELLREGQATFRKTGGLHAAALFDAAGRLDVLREDVGRHNAVDKVVGDAFLGRCLPLRDRILLVSGRTSYEILQKAVAAGVPVVAAVGAPSSLAVEVARRSGVTLLGFLGERGFNVYAGGERVEAGTP